MAVTSHVFPNFTQQMGTHNTNQIDFSGGTVDTLKVGLIASGGNALTWNSTSEGFTTVTSFLAGSGAGSLTEVTGGSYARQSLSSVAYTTSGLVNTLTCANVTFSAVTFSAVYAFFYDYTAGGSSDSAGLMICYWDFGGTQSVTGANFTLTISGSGLVTWTNS